MTLTLKKAALLLAVFASANFIAQAQDAKPSKVMAGSFIFKYSKPWVEKPSSSSMRAGELTYKFTEEQKLENVHVVFYYFGQGHGGDTGDNLKRWVGQFQGQPKSESEALEINGTKVTFLTASGTYMESSGGPFAGKKTARPNYTLLGAVVESSQGNVFVKLFGPDASVEAVKKPFKDLVRSALGKK